MSHSSNFSIQHFLEGSYQLFQQKNYQQALLQIRQGLKHFPYNEKLLFQYGLFLLALKQYPQAQEIFVKIIKLKPNFSEAHFHLGQTFQTLGQTSQAYFSVKQAIEINKKPEYYLFLAKVLRQHIQASEVIETYLEGLLFNSGHLSLLQELFAYLTQIDFNHEHWKLFIEKGFEQALLCAYESNIIDNLTLAKYTLKILMQLSTIQDLLQTQKIEAISLNQLNQIELLHTYLQHCFNINWSLEQLLTSIRKYFLTHAFDFTLLQENKRLLTSLIQQCWNNEYVFAETEEEVKCLTQLNQENQFHLALYALYRPFWEDKMTFNHTFNHFPIIDKLIKNQDELNRLKHKIEVLTPVDVSSKALQQQYEENPYPRWLSLSKSPAIILKHTFTHLYPHLPLQEWTEPESILIAGCGSGQHALRMACSLPHLKVIAIDLSKSSLAYGQQQAQRLNISNIEFFQADLLNFEQKFKIIDCSGVLHHLTEPLKGWEQLNHCLEDEGFIKISLYSKFARADIYKLQVQLSKQESSIQKIRAIRSHVINQDGGQRLLDIADFYTSSTCRDLLLHVQDQAFDLLEIKKTLKRYNLKFLGFEGLSELVQERYKKDYPEDKKMINLENWHQFEQKNNRTFLSMYQFWCFKQKND